MSTIGKRISKTRIRMNINQKELAIKAGISEASLSRYERDIREPKVSIVAEIARVLGVSTDYIFGRFNNVYIANKDTLLTDTYEADEICDTIINKFTKSTILIDGEVATKEAINCMIDAIRMGLLLAKEHQKSK